MSVLLGLVWLIAGTPMLMASEGTENYGGLSGWGLALAITAALDIAGGHRTS